jgi:hypothetical protein
LRFSVETCVRRSSRDFHFYQNLHFFHLKPTHPTSIFSISNRSNALLPNPIRTNDLVRKHTMNTIADHTPSVSLAGNGTPNAARKLIGSCQFGPDENFFIQEPQSNGDPTRILLPTPGHAHELAFASLIETAPTDDEKTHFKKMRTACRMIVINAHNWPPADCVNRVEDIADRIGISKGTAHGKNKDGSLVFYKFRHVYDRNKWVAHVLEHQPLGSLSNQGRTDLWKASQRFLKSAMASALRVKALCSTADPESTTEASSPEEHNPKTEASSPKQQKRSSKRQKRSKLQPNFYPSFLLSFSRSCYSLPFFPFSFIHAVPSFLAFPSLPWCLSFRRWVPSFSFLSAPSGNSSSCRVPSFLPSFFPSSLPSFRLSFCLSFFLPSLR